ncbi:MAG: Holliday junction branch migration protein RuvA [Lachnospiraceae bacterium]|jgi:Holliday junction DNA helicase RuvA
MIAYIKGEVADIEENKIILENQQIGYNIFMPMSYADLHIGEEVKIYTYLHVKEDAMQLYGFLTKDDLQIFQLLLGVNGIGPKGALGILSGLTADELRFAVLAEDAATIAKAPGIGKKTAQKLILELKDKLNLESAFEQKLENQKNSPLSEDDSSRNNKKEAVQALVALGYSSADALRAVKQVEDAEHMEIEEILKQALKKMSF